jgi:hypothetical protein
MIFGALALHICLDLEPARRALPTKESGDSFSRV